MGRLDRVVKEALGISFWEFLKYLAGLIFTTSTMMLISKILVKLVPIFNDYGMYIIVILSSGAIFLFLYILQRVNKFRPHYSAIDFDYLVLEKEVSYEYITKEKMVYTKRNSLKALKNNLDTYHDKYLWTGKGNVNIKSAIKRHTYFEVEPSKNIWQFYEIKFHKYLKKGETEETEIIWELEDLEQKAVPFFSATIEEPTEKVIFNLSLNPEFDVKEAICEETCSIGAQKPFHTRTVKLDRNGKAQWIIKHPKLLHHYEMRWIF